MTLPRIPMTVSLLACAAVGLGACGSEDRKGDQAATNRAAAPAAPAPAAATGRLDASDQRTLTDALTVVRATCHGRRAGELDGAVAFLVALRQQNAGDRGRDLAGRVRTGGAISKAAAAQLRACGRTAAARRLTAAT